jgi:hypothetical protein
MLLLVSASLPACDQDATLVTMRIDHYQDPCMGFEPAYCLRVTQTSDPRVTDADMISGFEHQWGYTYEILASVTNLSEGGAPVVDLVEIVMQQPVDPTEARIELHLWPEFIERVDDRGFELLGDKPASCETPEVCRSISTALVEDRQFRMRLRYPADARGRLVAEQIELLGAAQPQ